ncbi:MAG: SDR family oxidoreductase, partial [Nannocystaceae bacterium]
YDDLGVGESALDVRALDHVFHLAALYDITADEAALTAANVDGTRRLIALLRSGGFRGVLHHASSIAVAGDYAGVFREEQLDVGQRHPNPYQRSKFEAERLVRGAVGVRVRIYRPSAIVGHSRTGEALRADGPYYLFKVALTLRDALPRWFPLYGLLDAPINMVPVDHVAAALDVLAHKPGLDGQTFHVVDPAPPRLLDTWNLLADASGAPRLRRTIGGRFAARFAGVTQLAGQLGGLRFLRDQLLADFKIPREVRDAWRRDVRYDTENLERALAGTGVRCPPQAAYIEPLWDFWLRNLDPDRKPAALREACLSGQVVMITGASSGIGEALAYKCAAAGATVVLVARRELQLARVAATIRDAGGRATVVAADLSSVEDCDRAVAEALAIHDRVDVLINNAGRSIRRPLAASLDRYHDFERVMQLNFFAPVRLIRGVLPGMRARRRGHIVNVLSAGVAMPAPRFGVYAASKAALGSLAGTLAAEHAHEGIFATDALLSWVRTPMMDATGKYKDTRAMTPDEAADVILDGVVRRARTVMTGDTRRRWILNALAPVHLTRLANLVYRLYADDPSEHPELALDRSMLAQLIKGKLI